MNATPAYDLVALGEVMLRLDPGAHRVRTARSFRVWEGGGEYNVARGLRRCFRQRTAIVTALVDNDVGRLVEDFMLQGGVDVSHVVWKPFDGLGRASRNGLNFTERGFGVRGAVGVSDRGHTAVAQMVPEEVDWDHLFGRLGARWFHTGGIFAGLSSSTPEVAERAMASARRHGVKVSYDLNYRPSLWEHHGGRSRAREVNRLLAPYVDVMFGNEEDFSAALGFDLPGTDADFTELDVDGFELMISEVSSAFPDLEVIATTLRAVRSATVNDWSAVAWSPSTGLLHSKALPGLEIFDRVGGGDSFASGLIFGMLEEWELEKALDCGVAHGALAMTTPGDTSMASLGEVLAVMEGRAARVRR
jgi:2-dehydro-3-deoxygluconokinase